MQKARSIPTPLLDTSLRSPIEIVATQEPDRFRLLSILGFILRATLLWWRASFQLLLKGRSDTRRGARELRLFLERMGGMWIKAGQIISLRRDFFRPETCDELGRLQDSARGFPWEVVRRTVEEDLGQPIEALFSEFNEAPLAAASIGQVHEARLRENGVRVVVKVQRPFVADGFKRDLRYLWFAARWLERLGVARQARWNDMMWELEKTLVEELDYRMEAASIKRMRKKLKAHKVYAPKVFFRYCSRRILVMEFIEGTFMSEYIRAAEQAPERLKQWRAENNIDPDKVGERLYLMHQRQMIEDNLMHCDLHPGNIVLLRDSRFALIDFGSVGSVEKARRQRYRSLYAALAEGDYEKMVDIFLLQSPPLPNDKDLAAYKAEMVRVLRSWEARTSIKSLPYQEKSMSTLYNEFIQVNQRYNLPAGWDFLNMSRAQTTLDSAMMSLCPAVDFLELSRKYNQQATARRLQQGMKRKSVLSGLGKLMTVTELPGLLTENLQHEGEWLRQRARNFEGKISQMAILARTVLTLLGFAAFSVLTLSVGAYIRHLTGRPAAREPQWMRQLWSSLPEFGPEVWILVAVVGLYLFGKLTKIRGYAQSREYFRAGR